MLLNSSAKYPVLLTQMKHNGNHNWSSIFAGLNQEIVFKDHLLDNLRKDSSKLGKNSNTVELSLVRQLENEKEARLAQQARIWTITSSPFSVNPLLLRFWLCKYIAFLCQELDRLELETKTKDAKIQKLLERVTLTESFSESAVTETKTLRQQLTTLRENYFLSLGRSVKLQGSLVGWYASI